MPVTPRGLPEAVATIGVFDGVHLGHQALLRQVVGRARDLGALSVCVTFSPHPEDVLRPDTAIAHLAPMEDRIASIKSLGISRVVLLEFTLAMAQLSPEQFIDRFQERFRLRELWIGSDFALGKDRAGGPDRLAAIGASEGFTVRSFPPILLDGQVVSSSRVRRLLAGGEVEQAGRLLGRYYRLRGRVVAGDHRGHVLGFPTVNITIEERLCLPADGVYAVWCQRHGSPAQPGVANLGVRPTFDGGRRLLEVHLIGFEGDLYGELMATDFVARLRDERRFASVRELTDQIAKDVRDAEELLKTSPAPQPQSPSRVSR